MRGSSRRGAPGFGLWALTLACLAALLAVSVVDAGATSTNRSARPAGRHRLDPLPPRGLTQSAVPEPASPWQGLINPPPFYPSAMLLLTDGSVMVQEDGTNNWWRLRPDATGSYRNGTWSQLASMQSGYGPTYFASAVLPDGRVIVEGGEYNFGVAQATNEGAIYDPVANKWTTMSPPAGSSWGIVGDAQSVVLPNGKFMLATITDASQALLDASTLTWTSTGTGKGDNNDEEGWTLLPNGKVLTVDADALASAQNSELYDPATGSWTSAGVTPVPLIDPTLSELGPQVLRPDGTVFVAGGLGQNAVYNSGSGTWATAPSFPVIDNEQYRVADGPGAVLANGTVLLDASLGFDKPSHFFVFDGSALTPITDPPGAENSAAYYSEMLELPNGQVLLNEKGTGMYVYTAGGSPLSTWRPQISSVPSTLVARHTYSLSGLQLNGLTQGAMYGDDYQSATNYPLVRIKNNASQKVVYARTSGMTSMSIAVNAPSSVNFALPAAIDPGPSTLVVVANGIASTAVSVNVKTVPGAPTAATAVPFASGVAKVSWAAPASSGGDAITSYVVTPYRGTTARPATTFSSATTTRSIPGLQNGKSYRFTIAAINAVGKGPVSTKSAAIVVGTPAKPAKPKVSNLASGSLQVKFAPPNNGGASITSYTVSCTSTNGGVPGSATGPSSPLTVPGLNAGKKYTCTVKARNSRGSGPASPPSASVVA